MRIVIKMTVQAGTKAKLALFHITKFEEALDPLHYLVSICILVSSKGHIAPIGSLTAIT
jgi:hypothetical protein